MTGNRKPDMDSPDRRKAGIARAILSAIILVFLCGCDSQDSLIGWHELPNRHFQTREVLPGPGTLIPVFKVDGAYYSIARGFEVPLKPCAEGLEIWPARHGMKASIIGFDEKEGRVYIIINDYMSSCMIEWWVADEKRFLEKAEAPSWLPDSIEAKAPETNDGFIGFYQPVWYPIRIEVKKDGGKYLTNDYGLDSQCLWKPRHPFDEIAPLPEGLGFSLGKGNEKARLIYNESRRRYEITLGDASCLARMPLERIPSLDAPWKPLYSPKSGGVGIPVWH